MNNTLPHPRIALFPGTFDPFTIGHQSLVDRALELVDEIIIAVGVNLQKETYFPLEERIDSIRRLYAGNPHVQALAYEGLTADFAQSQNAHFILRGIRTVNDFEYEKNIADVNRMMTGLETIILFTEPGYTHISSGIVRELLCYGKDVTPFLPHSPRNQKK
jgi:pantetheine-phosphate adenylyltransferase